MKQDPRRPFTVCVEGNIGCGKTTFLEHFSQFEKQVEVLTEPVDRWRNVNGHNLLQLMYEDPERGSLPFLVESLVLLWVQGQAWAELKALWQDGLLEYMKVRLHWFKMIILATESDQGNSGLRVRSP